MREEFYRPSGESIVGKSSLSTTDLGPVSITMHALAKAYTFILKHYTKELWDQLFNNMTNEVLYDRPDEQDQT